MLIDLSTLAVVPKAVRPLDQQDAFESRKLWEGVTSEPHGLPRYCCWELRLSCR
jgi:hypothetical protein